MAITLNPLTFDDDTAELSCLGFLGTLSEVDSDRFFFDSLVIPVPLPLPLICMHKT